MMRIFQTALLCAGLAWPGLSVAQSGQQPETFGDWVLVCEESQPCRLFQQQTEADNGNLALRLIAMRLNEGAVLAAQMPMGVHLPSGAVFRLDTPADAPQQQMVWQRCLGDVCEAAVQLDPAALAQFEQSGQLIFAYRMRPTDEPRFIQVNLEGFAEGLSKTGE